SFEVSAPRGLLAFVGQGERRHGRLRFANGKRIVRLTSDEMEGEKLQAVHALQTAIARWLGRPVPVTIPGLMCPSAAVNAPPLRIVAIGASNTHGFYVGNEGAYPAQLQALLRAKGIDAQVTNAGVPLETTGMMLRRIDKDVPAGTDIVILEPGGNDKRF